MTAATKDIEQTPDTTEQVADHQWWLLTFFRTTLVGPFDTAAEADWFNKRLMGKTATGVISWERNPAGATLEEFWPGPLMSPDEYANTHRV